MARHSTYAWTVTPKYQAGIGTVSGADREMLQEFKAGCVPKGWGQKGRLPGGLNWALKENSVERKVKAKQSWCALPRAQMCASRLHCLCFRR